METINRYLYGAYYSAYCTVYGEESHLGGDAVPIWTLSGDVETI